MPDTADLTTHRSEAGARQDGGANRTDGNGDRSRLKTDKGSTSISDSVVSKVAGLAAREVSGVHDMGSGAARAFGQLKGMLGSSDSDRSSPNRGVKVEVGERQAAIDLDLVMDYGVAIPSIAESVRRNVINRVESMTGLEVVEVNVSVDDIWLGESGDQQARVA